MLRDVVVMLWEYGGKLMPQRGEAGSCLSFSFSIFYVQLFLWQHEDCSNIPLYFPPLQDQVQMYSVKKHLLVSVTVLTQRFR